MMIQSKVKMRELKKVDKPGVSNISSHLVVSAIIACITDVLIKGILVDVLLTQQSNWINQVLTMRKI